MYLRSDCRAWGSAHRVLLVTLFLVAALALVSCQSRIGTAEQEFVVLPAGDAAAGAELFRALSCHVCHAVEGDSSFAEPLVPDPGPVIGGPQSNWDAGRIATSIIAPSHTIKDYKPEWMIEGASKMPDFNSTVTVQQLLDLVSFIESAGV